MHYTITMYDIISLGINDIFWFWHQKNFVNIKILNESVCLSVLHSIIGGTRQFKGPRPSLFHFIALRMARTGCRQVTAMSFNEK